MSMPTASLAKWLSMARFTRVILLMTRNVSLIFRVQNFSLTSISIVASPIRLIDDISPVKGSSNKNLNCGQNAQKADLVANANPGSSLTFSWMAGGGQKVRNHRVTPASF